MTPTYGIITITLNAAETLPRTIDSVAAQDPAPAQVVFVDGGSADGTLAVIEGRRRELEDRGCAVTVVQQTNREGVAGIPAAWNLGLEVLRTDIVFILNGDDWYEPYAAASVLHTFAEQPRCDAVISPIRYSTGPDDPHPRIMKPRPFVLFPVLMPVMHPGCFVRRRVYERLGGFDTRYRISADYEFMYRCRANGIEFAHLDRPVTNMLAGGTAVSNRQPAREETLEIALRYTRVPVLSRLAYRLRVLSNR